MNVKLMGHPHGDAHEGSVGDAESRFFIIARLQMTEAGALSAKYMTALTS